MDLNQRTNFNPKKKKPNLNSHVYISYDIIQFIQYTFVHVYHTIHELVRCVSTIQCLFTRCDLYCITYNTNNYGCNDQCSLNNVGKNCWIDYFQQNIRRMECIQIYLVSWTLSENRVWQTRLWAGKQTL